MANTISPVCCGRPRKSRFCPSCGKELLGEGPVWELLAQTETTARKHRNDYNYMTADGWSDGQVERAKRRAEKWESWAKSLRDLLEDGKQMRA